MTFTQELAKRSKSFVYKFRICIGRRLDDLSWTQAPAPNDDCFYIDHPEGSPASVREFLISTRAITECTSRASLALCEANAGSWFFDSSNDRLYIHTTTGADPGSGDFLIESHFWKCYSDRQRPRPNEVTYAGKKCLPFLAADSIPDVTLETAMFSEGGIKQSFGPVKLKNGRHRLDQELNDYIFEAAPAVLEIGTFGDADGIFRTIWRGWTGSWEYQEPDVIINIEDEAKIAD